MKTNVLERVTKRTHEGGEAFAHLTPVKELRRSLMTSMLWEKSFYESGSAHAKRLAGLIAKVEPSVVVQLAIEARDKMKLRHAPLFVLRELARRKNTAPFLADGIEHCIQRADELAEFLAIYWKDKKQPLAAGVKRGLKRAFAKFNEYQFAKYDREGAVRLRDAMFLTHPKPDGSKNGFTKSGREGVFKRIAERTLATPDTWEVELSAGKDKKATFERLLEEKKLGGLAVLRNLRNMQQAGVNEKLIVDRLMDGCGPALPFRFIAAAKHAPSLESVLEVAMMKSMEDQTKLPGKTLLLVDVSGSMEDKLTAKSEITRLGAACGLAILLREVSEQFACGSFSTEVVVVPPRRGFALADAIGSSQPHGGTRLGHALASLPTDADRVIVITDEQSSDTVPQSRWKNAYIINVAAYQNGVGDDKGYHKISGWSEAVVEYIRQYEAEAD